MEISTDWLGPYEIKIVFDNGVVKSITIDEEKVTFVVNGHRLRIYHKPLTREEFSKHLQDNLNLKVLRKDFPSYPT